MTHVSRDRADVVVVGAGAAGLATAIFAVRSAPDLRVCCLDGARHVGAKILVSGGSRCNVTNRVVTERDFQGGPSRIVRRILQAYPAERAARFFVEIGVALHEEENGKLFPDTGRSRTVLDALLAECDRLGIAIVRGARVARIAREPDGIFVIETGGAGVWRAGTIVLATGGRSLPKTGSDGFGYELARELGHGFVQTTPALVPLVLDGDRHLTLAGVSHEATLTLRGPTGSPRVALTGALLWTHFGISGPVALDMSRHWLRARLAGDTPQVVVSLCPGETFERLEETLLAHQAARPKARVQTILAQHLPGAVASRWLSELAVPPDCTMAHLTRDARRRVIRALLDTPLDVRDSRGYGYAEVTAGGVPLDEIDPASMASTRCDGLYLVGEILDVDGRLGGFNFQWAWSSAWVAGQAIGRGGA